MRGSNLPPGVTESMIPGNRPEDLKFDALFERFEIEMIDILDAFSAAEEKHPGWPQDPIHWTSIIAEEVGEACREAIDLVYAARSVEHASDLVRKLKTELAQIGAMALRSLEALNRMNQNYNKQCIAVTSKQLDFFKRFAEQWQEEQSIGTIEEA